jgi:hypothetical protein
MIQLSWTEIGIIITFIGYIIGTVYHFGVHAGQIKEINDALKRIEEWKKNHIHDHEIATNGLKEVLQEIFVKFEGLNNQMISIAKDIGQLIGKVKS